MKRNGVFCWVCTVLLLLALGLVFFGGFVVGKASADTLTFTTNLSYGQHGKDVESLQEFLIGKGFLGAEPTGNYLGLTQQAVRNFQRANGLPATGFFGPLSRGLANEQVENILNVPNQGQAPEAADGGAGGVPVVGSPSGGAGASDGVSGQGGPNGDVRAGVDASVEGELGGSGSPGAQPSQDQAAYGFDATNTQASSPAPTQAPGATSSPDSPTPVTPTCTIGIVGPQVVWTSVGGGDIVMRWYNDDYDITKDLNHGEWPKSLGGQNYPTNGWFDYANLPHTASEGTTTLLMTFPSSFSDDKATCQVQFKA